MTWQAQEFKPGGESVDVAVIVRIASTELGPLMSPTLVVAENETEKQLKIVHGNNAPMIFFTEFDAGDVEAAKELFVVAAKILNEAEAAHGLKLSLEEAKLAAARTIRGRLLGR